MVPGEVWCDCQLLYVFICNLFYESEMMVHNNVLSFLPLLILRMVYMLYFICMVVGMQFHASDFLGHLFFFALQERPARVTLNTTVIFLGLIGMSIWICYSTGTMNHLKKNGKKPFQKNMGASTILPDMFVKPGSTNMTLRVWMRMNSLHYLEEAGMPRWQQVRQALLSERVMSSVMHKRWRSQSVLVTWYHWKHH